jgi:hypothetical protein
MFTKVDLGKSEVTFWCEPHVVSKGGEKNFVHFMEQVTEKNPKVDEDTFKEVVGRLILVRSMEDVVKGLKQGGYKANVVAYGLAYLYTKFGARLDFQQIWKNQGVSDNMKKVLTVLAKRAYEHIITTTGAQNVTEWAKKDRCWEAFAGKSISIELGEEDGLKASGAAAKKTAAGTPKKPKTAAKELPEEMCDADAWLEMVKWSLDRDEYDPKARRFMKGVSVIIRKKLDFTVPQLKWAVSLWESAVKAGFKP